VNAAGDFAGCIKTGNRLLIAIHHLSLGVDLNAAHGVVHRHRQTTAVERGLFDLVNEDIWIATERILLRLNSLVVFGHCTLEIFRRNLQLHSQFVQRVSLFGVAGLKRAVESLARTGLHGVVAIGVTNAENDLVGRSQNGICHHIAALVFSHETIAVLIDKNDAFNRRHHTNETTIGSCARQQLNKVHTDHIGANILGWSQKVPRRAFMVSRRQIKESRIVLSTYDRIGSKTAGSHHNSL